MFRFPSLLSVFISFYAAAALVSCTSGYASVPSLQPWAFGKPNGTSQKIQHVVLIVQENRSFDNLFATFPRAHGATVGHWKTANGERKQHLKAGNLYLPTDITHCNAAFKVAYDGGKMDGFNDEHYGVCGSGGKIGDGKPVWSITRTNMSIRR